MLFRYDLSRVTPEDIRAEYSALVTYHTSLVNGRFTLAGLFVAGLGLLGGAVLRNDVPPRAKVLGATLGLLLTVCLWILELRTRSLFASLAMRGIDIEHDHFGLTGRNWYSGFFTRQYAVWSRQYKVTPDPSRSDPDVPPLPGPDRVFVVFLLGRPLPNWLCKGITHSLGLDLLYAGACLFWAFVILWYLRKGVLYF